MMKMRECLVRFENPNPVSGRRHCFVPSLVSLRQPSTPTFAGYPRYKITPRVPRARRVQHTRCPSSSSRNISSRPAPSSSRPAASARKEFKAKHVIGTSRASSSRSSRTRSRWRRFRPRARSPSTRRRRSRSHAAYRLRYFLRPSAVGDLHVITHRLSCVQEAYPHVLDDEFYIIYRELIYRELIYTDYIF